MDIGILILLGVVMAVGLVGVIIPVLPGLVLVAVAALVWAIMGEGVAPWVVFGVIMVVLILGTIAKFAWPGRTLKQAGAPTSTMLLGALGAIVGFFVIPVVGLIVGAILGVYLGELRRLGDARPAWDSTWVTTKAVGVGILIELSAGVLAVGIWFVSVLAGVGS